jgi:ATP-dependent HslUV protease ATP-binding subunit HslU
MIRDLVEAAIRMVKQKRYETVREQAAKNARKAWEMLVPNKRAHRRRTFRGFVRHEPADRAGAVGDRRGKQKRLSRREEIAKNLKRESLSTL